jgi:hyperosmotically inducible protein
MSPEVVDPAVTDRRDSAEIPRKHAASLALPLPLRIGVMMATPAMAAHRGRRFRAMKAFLLSGLMLLTLAAGIASAQQTPDRRDVQLADRIVRSVNTYPQFTIFDDVNARIDQGVVTLTGKVTMPFKRNDIGRRIEKIDGVKEVQNNIDVLPVSNFDEQLRYRVARAIYGNPSFWTYAAMANPPIHVIVENGRVRLTGVVNSNVERMLARSLATGLGELSVESELRTDAEARS